MIHDSDTSQSQLLALQAWWQRHCKVFSTWWLCSPAAERLELLLAASPDMPLVNSATRAQNGEPLLATDLLLPELSQDALTASGGKLLVMLLTKRLVPPDLGFKTDINFLNDLRKAGKLPNLDASGALQKLQDAWVDPMDPTESIVVLKQPAEGATEEELTAAQEARERLLKEFESKSLVRAEVWLAFRLRRDQLSDFMLSLILAVEARVAKECADKSEPDCIAPNYAALLAAEVKMQELESERQGTVGK